jgi:hypothetical protein
LAQETSRFHQVIANVHGAWQRLGYYPYAMDGVLGLTQQPLRNCVTDRGLPITGATGAETLATLGFIS